MDRNHGQIVAALRAVGASVESLAAAGSGFPDLAVGYHGRNYLLEVKDGSKSASRKRLRPSQVDWHAAWRGQVAVVETVDQALRVIGAIASEQAPIRRPNP